jgi:L-fuconolactonase
MFRYNPLEMRLSPGFSPGFSSPWFPHFVSPRPLKISRAAPHDLIHPIWRPTNEVHQSMIIDAHQHFWLYEPAEYGWIDDEMALLRRDFRPSDLQMEMSKAGVDAALAVQARQSLAETEWLLKLASSFPFICGVVGWVPLAAPDVERHLEEFSNNSALKGVRHVVQDEPNEYFLNDDRFNAGVAALRRFDLTYDLLIYDRQLPRAIEFVDRHPHQQFILDHLAKPLVSKKSGRPWATHICELGQRENVACKISGLATQARSKGWNDEDLEPYLNTVLEAFGKRRLMFGSDWPVCLMATSYVRWYETIDRWAEPLTTDERKWLFGKSAMKVYKIHESKSSDET